MTTTLRIDVISDVVCPWCVIGIRGLERALADCADAVSARITLQPFELNPGMPPGGQDVAEHIAEKYGARSDDGGATRGRIKAMAAALGFDMASRPGARIYNTFDAHRLLHWAAGEGAAGEGEARQLALKHALFAAYFTLGLDPSDPDVLVGAAGQAGLDTARAAAVVTSDAFAAEVRAAQAGWRAEGITAVPTVIVEGRYVIQGAQEPAAYERALRRIAADVATTAG